ncbi:hypothetical protein Tco_0459705 [Tanacetum coccineum]
MAALKYRDEHNKIGFLEKPKGSTDYHQVIDSLLDSHIRYAIITDPLIYDSLITQFWSTASLRSSELGPPAIVATIDGTPYTITESLVRSQLQLHDEGEFTKSGSWDQFGSPLAIALICLCEGKKFNWSSYIFTGMVNNINNSKKFLMFPRFLQMILDIETRNTKPYHAFRLTSKMFANMRLNFHGNHMPLVAAMLPPTQAAIAAGTSGEAAPPNPQTDHETVTEPVHQTASPHDHGSTSPRPTPTTPAAQLNEPVSKPPRPIPTSPSAQVNQQGPSSDPHVESSSKDNDSNPDPNVADDPLGGSFFASPSRSTAAPPEGTTSGGADNSWRTLISSYVPPFNTDSFIPGNDVPTGTASDFFADPLTRGFCKEIYEMEKQAELAKVTEEMKKKRQEEDVINFARLTADLLGPDVNEENFAERMVTIIAERRRQFEAQSTDTKEVTYKDQVLMWNKPWVIRTFKILCQSPSELSVPAATHQSSASVTTNVHQSPFVDSPPSTPAVTPVTSVDPPVAPTPSFATPVSRSINLAGAVVFVAVSILQSYKDQKFY